MSTVHDPVHRARYRFEPDGENVIVDCWIEPGGVLPEHLHPRQEERWSVVEGQVRFGLGSTKRVIGPADGEMVVRAGDQTLARQRERRGSAPALPRDSRARPPALPRGERRGGTRRTVHARRAPRSLKGARWAARFLKRYRADVVMSFPPRPVQSAMVALLGRS